MSDSVEFMGITVRGLADMLHRTEARVYQLIKSGEIEEPIMNLGIQRAFSVEQAFRIWDARRSRDRMTISLHLPITPEYVTE